MQKCIRFLLCMLTLCSLTVALCGCGFSAATQALCDYWLNEPEATVPTTPSQETPGTTPPSTAQTPSTEPVNPPANVNIAGKYTLYSISLDGMTLDKDMIMQAMKYYGVEEEPLIIELHADGTGLMTGTMPDTKETLQANICWDSQAFWRVEDPTDRIAYTYNNNQITFVYNGAGAVLQKTVLSL